MRGKPGKRQLVRRINWRFYILVVCLAVFVVSGTMVLRDEIRSDRERRVNEDLAEQVNAIKQTVHRQPDPESPAEEPMELVELYDENGVLIQYSALSQQNPDMAGWLSISGTQIDYPVMYAADRKEYYLRRGFDQKYALSGSLFIDEDCVLDTNHLLIYGHHMKDGSMFGTLPEYADADYAALHPIIFFDTLTQEGKYEVLGAFYSRVYTRNETGGFRYYKYEDLTDPAVFEEYVSQVKEAALYDTGVEATYGDVLLSLSTCSYHTDGGRFVVVAKKIL